MAVGAGGLLAGLEARDALGRERLRGGLRGDDEARGELVVERAPGEPVGDERHHGQGDERGEERRRGRSGGARADATPGRARRTNRARRRLPPASAAPAAAAGRGRDLGALLEEEVAHDREHDLGRVPPEEHVAVAVVAAAAPVALRPAPAPERRLDDRGRREPVLLGGHEERRLAARREQRAVVERAVHRAERVLAHERGELREHARLQVLDARSRGCAGRPAARRCAC